jgi:hypothetical protein
MKHFGDMSLEVTLATLGLELLIIPTDLPATVRDFIAERRKAEMVGGRLARP